MEQFRQKYSRHLTNLEHNFDGLFRIHELSKAVNLIDPQNEINTWTMLDVFAQKFEKERDFPPFSPVTLSVVRLFPQECLYTVEKCFTELFPLQFHPSEDLKQQNIPQLSELEKARLLQKVTGLMGREFIESWKKTLQQQSPDIQQKAFGFLVYAVPHMETFFQCMHFLGTWDRYYTFPQQVYPPKDMKMIFFSDAVATSDFSRLVYSLHDYFSDKIGFEIAGQIINYLDLKYKEASVQIDLPDAVLFTIYLHFVFCYFEIFTEKQKVHLLQTYAYRAAVAGVDLQNLIRNDLYVTYTVIDYVENTGVYLNAIKTNTETLSGDAQKMIRVSDVLSQPLPDLNKLLTPEEFAGFNLVADLYQRLESGNIIEKNHRGDQVEREEREKELSDIITWFFEDENWNKIADYYAHKDDALPIEVFFEQLKNNIDLEKPMAQEKMLKFNQFLHESQLIAPEEELIEFFEQDGTFHWNEELTK